MTTISRQLFESIVYRIDQVFVLAVFLKVDERIDGSVFYDLDRAVI